MSWQVRRVRSWFPRLFFLPHWPPVGVGVWLTQKMSFFVTSAGMGDGGNLGGLSEERMRIARSWQQRPGPKNVCGERT